LEKLLTSQRPDFADPITVWLFGFRRVHNKGGDSHDYAPSVKCFFRLFIVVQAAKKENPFSPRAMFNSEGKSGQEKIVKFFTFRKS
jgi:hypothetical protein